MHKSLMHICSILSYSELHKKMFCLCNALGADSYKGSKNKIIIMGVNHISWCWLGGFSLNMLNLCSKLCNALCRFAFLIQQSCVLLHKPREVKYENAQLGCRLTCAVECTACLNLRLCLKICPLQSCSQNSTTLLNWSLFSCLEKAWTGPNQVFGNALLLCSCQEALELALNSNVDQCEWW